MINVGNIDRILRIVVGVGILGLGYYYGSYWGFVGLVPLGTGLIGSCPLYSICKINSCKRV